MPPSAPTPVDSGLGRAPSGSWTPAVLFIVLATAAAAVSAFLAPGWIATLQTAQQVPSEPGWLLATSMELASRASAPLAFGRALALVLVAGLLLPLVLRRPWSAILGWTAALAAGLALAIPVVGARQPAHRWQVAQERQQAERAAAAAQRAREEEALRPQPERRQDWAPKVVR